MAARQQQRTRRALAEPGGEQRRTADLGGDQRFDLVGLEDEDICSRRGFARVGQAHHDSVVGCGRLLIDAITLKQSPAHGQCQRAVDPQSVGGVQDHPPVTQLVTEPLDDQRGVAGHHGGRGALIVEQFPEVISGVVGQTDVSATRVEVSTIQTGELTGESADRRSEFGRPAHGIAAPEWKSGGQARGGDHHHPVMGDLGDAPAGRTQCYHVAGPGLVDHLFVEFADPRGFFAHQIHREHSTIGDRAAGGDGQSLRSGAPGEGAGVPVVDQPGSQFGEIRRRILAAQKIQGGFVGAAGQGRERGTAPHGVKPRLGVQGLQRTGRHGVLGEDVQRIGRHPHGFDLTGDHALHAHRAADQIGAVLGQQHAAGDFADLMAGPADPLQPAGHRRWGLDLDHEIDRAHIDPEFEARGCDDGPQPSGLEVVLDLGALLFGYRSMVCPGERDGDLGIRSLGVDLIDAGGDPLGEPT